MRGGQAPLMTRQTKLGSLVFPHHLLHDLADTLIHLAGPARCLELGLLGSPGSGLIKSD